LPTCPWTAAHRPSELRAGDSGLAGDPRADEEPDELIGDDFPLAFLLNEEDAARLPGLGGHRGRRVSSPFPLGSHEMLDAEVAAHAARALAVPGIPHDWLGRPCCTESCLLTAVVSDKARGLKEMYAVADEWQKHEAHGPALGHYEPGGDRAGRCASKLTRVQPALRLRPGSVTCAPTAPPSAAAGTEPPPKKARVLWNDVSGERKVTRYTRRNAFLVASLQSPLLEGLCFEARLRILCVKSKSLHSESYDEQSVVDQADIRVRRILRGKRKPEQPSYAELTRMACCDCNCLQRTTEDTLRARDNKFAAATSVAQEKIASAEFMFADLAGAGRCPKAASLLFGTSLEENKRLHRLATNADVLEDISSIVTSARLTKAKGRAAANRTALAILSSWRDFMEVYVNGGHTGTHYVRGHTTIVPALRHLPEGHGDSSCRL